MIHKALNASEIFSVAQKQGCKCMPQPMWSHAMPSQSGFPLVKKYFNHVKFFDSGKIEIALLPDSCAASNMP
jgi:hypothetical protein